MSSLSFFFVRQALPRRRLFLLPRKNKGHLPAVPIVLHTDISAKLFIYVY